MLANIRSCQSSIDVHFSVPARPFATPGEEKKEPRKKEPKGLFRAEGAIFFGTLIYIRCFGFWNMQYLLLFISVYRFLFCDDSFFPARPPFARTDPGTLK